LKNQHRTSILSLRFSNFFFLFFTSLEAPASSGFKCCARLFRAR